MRCLFLVAAFALLALGGGGGGGGGGVDAAMKRDYKNHESVSCPTRRILSTPCISTLHLSTQHARPLCRHAPPSCVRVIRGGTLRNNARTNTFLLSLSQHNNSKH
jgi:hypothetical protein